MLRAHAKTLYFAIRESPNFHSLMLTTSHTVTHSFAVH